jgi:hypothetical protein
MAKPTLLPRHAETSGGTPDANITEPSSGEKDTGYVSGTAASSSKTNWILWIIYLWIKWLDGTITTKQTKRVARRRQVHLGAAYVVNPANGAEIVVSGGAGNIARIPDMDGGALSFANNTNSPRTIVPINLDEDEQLEQVKARVQLYDTACVVTMKVYRMDYSPTTFGAGDKDQLGSTQTTTATTNRQNLDCSGLTELIDGLGEAGEWYTHVVEFDCSAFTLGYEIQALSIYTSVPTPP